MTWFCPHGMFLIAVSFDFFMGCRPRVKLPLIRPCPRPATRVNCGSLCDMPSSTMWQWNWGWSEIDQLNWDINFIANWILQIGNLRAWNSSLQYIFPGHLWTTVQNRRSNWNSKQTYNPKKWYPTMFYQDVRNWQMFQFANRYVFPDSEHEGVEKSWNHQVLWSTYWRYIKLPFWLAAKMCRSQFGHLTSWRVLPRNPIVPTTIFLDMSQRLGDRIDLGVRTLK